MIGVFDSGVGGLSILHALRQRLPHASMTYVGDVANAPYGNLPIEDIRSRSYRIVSWLIEAGANQIVVACNTATVAAIDSLRARWPECVFTGVEPGVKPAAQRTRNGRIAVMATTATVKSARLQKLIAEHASDTMVHLQACDGLADAIERGVLAGKELDEVLSPHCEALRAAHVDTVVLGCTHYAFVKNAIQSLLGNDVMLIDVAPAVAERAAQCWAKRGCSSSSAVRIVSTGSMSTMRTLLASSGELYELNVVTERI